MSSRTFWRFGPPVIVFIVGVIGLEMYLRLAHVPAYIVMPPSAVLRLFLDRDELADLARASLWTSLAAVFGFLASAVVGIAIALVLSTSTLVRRAIYPYMIIFQTVPIIAIAPLLVISLGYGLWPVTVCAFIVSVFPVIVNTLGGLLSTDPALSDLFLLYGANPAVTMWKLRLPSALPSIFSGLRIASGLAVIGTVVAEFMVGNAVGRVGLGMKIYTGAAHRVDIATAAALLASLLGLAMFAVVNIASFLTLRKWHASERSRRS